MTQTNWLSTIRRKHTHLGFLLCSLLIGISHNAAAQCQAYAAPAESATGFIFEDSDGDGRRSSGESGIAGVSVSNGCDVVVSGLDGSYAIGLAATQILFISQPATYQVAADENQIPQFFYSHYPNGVPDIIAGTSVEWQWPVTEATGPLPDSIDFPLYQNPDASQNFTAHAFADPQAKYAIGEDMVREDLVNSLIGNPFGAEFGITVGDVVFDTLSLYDRHKQMMSLMDIPQWYLPGNHDINYESPNGLFANETYKRHFGPTYYSFNFGNVHFVALNNVDYAGDGKEFDRGRYRGWIPQQQLTWLQRDLQQVSKDKLIVIASHIPLVAGAEDAIGSPAATGPGTENFSRLLEILAPFSNIYAMAGHDTSNSWKVEINHEHGWQGAPWIAHTLAEVRGNGWLTGPEDLRGVRDAMMQDGNPNGYYLLKFNDTGVVPEFIPFPFGRDASQRMRIVLDPPLVPAEAGSIGRGSLAANTKLVVNLFDGGPRDKVWVSVNGETEAQMTYTVRTDPFFTQAANALQGSEDAFGQPTLSGHIWESEIATQLLRGINRIEVRSEDEFGQRQRGAMSFELSGP